MSRSAGHDIDPTYYRQRPADAISAPPEQLACVVVRPRRAAAGCACRARHDPGVRPVRPGRRLGRPAHPRRRAAPLRVERVQQRVRPRRARHRRAAAALPAAPGLRSSNIHVYDTDPDPRQPTLAKTISAAELAAKAGYSRPHTLHCGPDGIFVPASAAQRSRRPGRHRPARPRHLRRAAGLGDRPRATSTWPTTPGGT